MRPILLHYYVTNRCNARCSFCDIWRQPAIPDAEPSAVAVNLRHAREAGCRFVDFTGGEPLLNPHLPAFLRMARKFGYVTSITTNCLLFPKRAEELRGLVDLLHFSLDADTAKDHDALRGVPSFDRVIDSIDVALSNRLVPDLLFTYTDENIDALEGVWRLALEKRLVLILDPVFALEGSDPCSPSTHAKARRFARQRGVYLNDAHLLLRKRGGNDPCAPLCRAVDSTAVILPDDRLALPCYHHRDTTEVINGRLDLLLAGPSRRDAARLQGSYHFCQKCHLNCYFDPSFSFMRNRFCLLSIKAKLKYAWEKYLRYRRPVPWRALLGG